MNFKVIALLIVVVLLVSGCLSNSEYHGCRQLCESNGMEYIDGTFTYGWCEKTINNSIRMRYTIEQNLNTGEFIMTNQDRGLI